MRDGLVHAEYLIWSGWAVKRANEGWRSRRPYRGETLIERGSLHFHLFRWAVETGLIEDPGPGRDKPYSYYVALAFRDGRDAVKVEAREFWRTMKKQHA